MIKKIILKNFKSYQNLELSFDSNLSILTGENNSGKTSILEAFLIFQESFNYALHKIERKTSRYVTKNILNIGEYYFKDSYIISFNSVRSTDYYELFYLDNEKFNIEVLFDDISIGFEVLKARGGNAYQIKPTISDDDLIKLNRNFDITNFLYATKSSSIYSINQYEPFYTPKMIEKLSSEGNKQSIFRNKLLKLKDKLLLDRLQTYIETIFGYEQFRLTIEFNANEDLYINTFFTLKDNQKQDIALLGSGTLQIIEVLINLLLVGSYENKIILLDEPDSHLHRDIQKVLIERLRDYSNNGLQIILTTHNEQIISLSKLEEIIHLYLNKDKETNIIEPISKQILKGRQFGFINPKKDIYDQLGISHNSMMFIEAIEADKIVLIEGKDKQYIELLEEKRRELFLSNKLSKKVVFWSFNGVSNLDIKVNRIKTLFELIKNKKNLWSKTILLIDKDYRKDNEIPKYDGIDTIYWNSYTIESIFLENLNPFKQYVKNRILENKEIENFDEIFNNIKIDFIDIEKYKKKISKQRDQYKLQDSIGFISSLESIQNRLFLLLGKDEIKEFIDKLYDSYDLEFNEELDSYLFNFINSLDTTTWNSSWNSILQSIYGE
jgi:predicted ATPase